MEAKLKIGKIPYANLFPVFRGLEKNCDLKDYEFVEGVPSELNKLLREGSLDISPSSSIEYLRDKDAYAYLEGHSVSSKGPVGSILLFSRLPIEDLDGHEVSVTHQSETSALLLAIVFKKFYGINAIRRVTKMPFKRAVKNHSAYLAIGDEALVAASGSHPVAMEIPRSDYRLSMIEHQVFYIYDLGDLWFKRTGLPFVFALWIARKNRMKEKKELFDKFKKDLDYIKPIMLKDAKKAAEASPLGNTLGTDNLVAFWREISYELDGAHKKGLELFERHLGELGLLAQCPL